MIKGSKVKIVHIGNIYSLYGSWEGLKNIQNTWKSCSGNTKQYTDQIGTIKVLQLHNSSRGKMLALVSIDGLHDVIIGTEGLQEIEHGHELYQIIEEEVAKLKET